MASGVSHSEWATTNHIVTEFFTKSSHIILESRIPNLIVQRQGGAITSPSSSSSLSGLKPRQKWFNLVLSDCPTALQVAEPWRTNISKPMVIDVLLLQTRARRAEVHGASGVPRGTVLMQTHSTGHDASIAEGPTDSASSEEESVVKTILERWIIWFDTQKKSNTFDTSDKKTEGLNVHSPMSGGWETTTVRVALELPSVYKKTVILLRYLYSIMRALPTHHLFRLANSYSESCNFSLDFRVSTVASPLSQSDELAMTPISLTPVETRWGKICLSVAYRHAAAVTALEVISPIQPRIITDYVIRPTTDPLRRFSGCSPVGSLHTGGLSGRREVHVVSVPSGSPSSPPVPYLLHRHSWSEDKLQPALQIPLSILPSSCPTGESLPGIENFNVQHSAPTQRPSFQSRQLPTTPLLHNDEQDVGIQPIILQDNYRFSPSPPTNLHHKDRSFKGPSSAPVRMQRHGFWTRETSPKPNRSLLPPQSPQRTSTGSSFQGTSSKSRFQMGQMQDWHGPSFGRNTSERPSSSNIAELKMLNLPPNTYNIYQVAADKKVEERLSFHSKSFYPPRPTLNSLRSASKSSSEDNLEEEFTFPFAVEEDEADEHHGRNEITGLLEPLYPSASTSQSQAAAVGALVRILKSASPLRQSASLSVISMPSHRDKPSVYHIHRGHGRITEISGGLGSEGPQVGSEGISASDMKSSKKQITQFQIQGKTHKTTFDALEELHGYQELKEFLQRQSGQNPVSEL
ncbi:hypothetical protein O6H91_19G016900 [Diphasiastrum complanatum]|uniref:Uncharacterized protein n=2 Tax=Diphasiastrum complanatum TaxID=34168 RepID=A0ACC2AT20_DIPCM|nr:hypothetical protein O6H91_19G016900 [Diphasiastrum complanatum]